MNSLSTTSLYILDKTLTQISTGSKGCSNERVSNQGLPDCLMPDMSEINPHDPAIVALFDIFQLHQPNPSLNDIQRGISRLRDPVEDNEFSRQLHALGESGKNLAHLDQLLAYVGAPPFSSTYEKVRTETHEYMNSNIHRPAIYSLGLEYSTCDLWFNRKSVVMMSDIKLTTVRQALEEARFLLKDQLAQVEKIDMEHLYSSDETHAKCDFISLYRDNVELMKFNVALPGGAINQRWIPLMKLLGTAVLFDSDKTLLDACMAEPELRNPRYQKFMNKVKGQTLESVLGL